MLICKRLPSCTYSGFNCVRPMGTRVGGGRGRAHSVRCRCSINDKFYIRAAMCTQNVAHQLRLAVQQFRYLLTFFCGSRSKPSARKQITTLLVLRRNYGDRWGSTLNFRYFQTESILVISLDGGGLRIGIGLRGLERALRSGRRFEFYPTSSSFSDERRNDVVGGILSISSCVPVYGCF